MRFKLLVGAISLFLSSILFISLVNADPGISVTITDVDVFITSPSDSATYTVKAESITTEDENVKLTVSGDPDLNFDWTTQEFLLPAGDTQSFSLEATVTTFTPGDYEFTVLGEAWPIFFTYDEALMMDLIETSSFTDYAHVTPPASVSSCDQEGKPQSTFLPGEEVYVKGSGFPPNIPYDSMMIYIIPDGQDALPGNAVASAHGMTDAAGALPVTLTWSPPLTMGEYDIWVDVNQNDVFDTGDAWNDQAIGVFAFNVIPEVPFGTAMAFLSMFIALVGFLKFKRFRPQ